jgi:hypothetical protein
MTKIRLHVWCVLAGLAAVGNACRSTPETPRRPDVDSLAYIEVQGHPSMEVARAVSEVFREAGFVPMPLGPNKAMKLVFEKPATTTDSVVFGDWSGKVWYRVKIDIGAADPDVLVRCDAYRVVGHGDPRFEEETRIAFRKGPYQELLDKAKGRLGKFENRRPKTEGSTKSE